MQPLHVEDRVVPLDDAGFLIDSADWDEGIATALARAHGVGPFNQDHWSVIRCIREYYEMFESPPMVRLVSKRTGLDRDRIAELFLTRCRDCMCRIAGLPKPTG